MERYDCLRRLVGWGETFLSGTLGGDRLILWVEDEPHVRFKAYHSLSLVVYRVKSRTEKEAVCVSDGTYRTDEECGAIIDRLAVEFLRCVTEYGV